MTLDEKIEKVARLHTLADELNQLATDLRAARVEVRCGPRADRHDPLGQLVYISITMDTGCGDAGPV